MSNGSDAWIEDLRKKARAQPDPETVAKNAEERRIFNGKAHRGEIAAVNERLARLHENNAVLAAIGKAPLNFPTPADLRDLSFSALKAQIALLDRLLSEQAQTLERHREEVEAARWEAALAQETPIVQMLLGRLEVVEAEFAEWKAERSDRDRAIARAAPVRSKVSMSNTGVGFGDGLTPSLSAPVAPSGISPRRIASR
jgi:hypothetical protein